MEYPVCIRETLDMEALIDKWNKNEVLIHKMNQIFTRGEYSLINFIVNEGLKDIYGQQPDITPPGDDPFASPGINRPNLDPDNPEDDDPFAKPVGWDPSSGIFYDDVTGNLIDKEGNIIINADGREKEEYWGDWVRYWMSKYPDNILNIPEVPKDKENPEYDDWIYYLRKKYGEEKFPLDEVEFTPGDPEFPETPIIPDNPDFTDPDLEENPYIKDWEDFYRQTVSETDELPPFPQDPSETEYWEDFMNYLASKYNGDEGISSGPLM